MDSSKGWRLPGRLREWLDSPRFWLLTGIMALQIARIYGLNPEVANILSSWLGGIFGVAMVDKTADKLGNSTYNQGSIVVNKGGTMDPEPKETTTVEETEPTTEETTTEEVA